MTDLVGHYEAIAEATREVRKQAFSELEALQSAHSSIDEVRAWHQALQNRPEAIIFAQVISGLELGLFALVSGLYRQAYGSLRLAVELIAGVSWFSSHRLDLAEWQTGERDLIWREITNPDEGILSPRYRKAFFPELNEERKYNSLYSKLYRELSEHVHGNARTWEAPDNIGFDKALHNQWLEKLQTFMLVMNVLLSLRYLQEIAEEHIRRLEPILRTRVPQVSAVMKFLEDRLPEPVQARPSDPVGFFERFVAPEGAVASDSEPMPANEPPLSPPRQITELSPEEKEQK